MSQHTPKPNRYYLGRVEVTLVGQNQQMAKQAFEEWAIALPQDIENVVGVQRIGNLKRRQGLR